MRTPLFGAILLMLFPMAGRSQDYVQTPTSKPPKSQNGSFADRVYFGGNIGLSFGTITSVQVEPMAGYILDKNRKLSAGLGISYWYYQDKRFVPEYESHSYGYRIFSRYRIIQPLYAHVEYSQQNFEYFRTDGSTVRQWVPFLLVGGGYVASMGGRSAFTAQILWDVLQDVNSPYGGQPFFSLGVGVGF
jgi:hypothetical protein